MTGGADNVDDLDLLRHGAMPALFSGIRAATPIPALSLIERMSVELAPITAFAPRSQAARAFRSLWAELNADAAQVADSLGLHGLQQEMVDRII